MDISTKCKINDLVYFLKDNKVTTGKVERIMIEVRKPGEPWITNFIFPSTVRYYEQKEDEYVRVDDAYVFHTKEELLASL